MTRPRATLATAAVLGALLADPDADHYGLELIRATGLGSGSVYPLLSRLEQAGWITGHWEDIDEAAVGRRRRRYYRLTEVGRREGAQLRQGVLSRLRIDVAPPVPAPGVGR